MYFSVAGDGKEWVIVTFIFMSFRSTCSVRVEIITWSYPGPDFPGTLLLFRSVAETASHDGIIFVVHKPFSLFLHPNFLE